MNPRLQIGESSVEFDIEPTSIAGRFDAPRGEPLADPAAQVATAFDRPLDMPPLAQALVPGDRVTIALDADLPCADALAAGVVSSLLRSGIESANITLLVSRAAADGEADPRGLLDEQLRGEVKFVVHDPADRRALGYVAATDDAAPIYVQRAIYDADFILPVGLVRGEGTLAYPGAQASLFPIFGDDEYLRRFINLGWVETPTEPIRRVREAEEANWLIGAPVAMLAVPGGGNSLLHLVGGVARSVGLAAQRLYSEAWSFTLPSKTDLVIAAISGGPGQQTWLNFARALAAADRCVNDEGTIILATDIAVEPAAALQTLAGSVDDDEAQRSLRKLHSADLLAAGQLLATRPRANVYLLSRLPAEWVEPLGLGHLSDTDDISRLAARGEECLILNHAQYVQIETPDE